MIVRAPEARVGRDSPVNARRHNDQSIFLLTSERRAQNHPGDRTRDGVGGKVLGQSAHQKRAADEDGAQTERVQNALFLW